MAPLPDGDAGKTDWILSEKSQVHIANHKDWFTNITYFKITLDFADAGNPDSLEVLGIGDVELELVKFEPDDAKSKKDYKLGTIVLRDVYWAPDSEVNVFSRPLSKLEISSPSKKSEDLRSKPSRPRLFDPTAKEHVGYILQNQGQKPRLWLSGRGPNESSMVPPMIPRRIEAIWSPMEIATWESHKEADVLGDSPKAWMKSQHRGEWQFFEEHGLDVYDQGDRAKAKLLIEADMPGGTGWTKVVDKKKKETAEKKKGVKDEKGRKETDKKKKKVGWKASGDGK